MRDVKLIMIDERVLGLIKNDSNSEEGKLQQKLVCAYIDGYMEGAAELDRYITKLYRKQDSNATVIYRNTKELREKVEKKYNDLIELLNSIE